MPAKDPRIRAGFPKFLTCSWDSAFLVISTEWHQGTNVERVCWFFETLSISLCPRSCSTDKDSSKLLNPRSHSQTHQTSSRRTRGWAASPSSLPLIKHSIQRSNYAETSALVSAQETQSAQRTRTLISDKLPSGTTKKSKKKSTMAVRSALIYKKALTTLIEESVRF